MVVVDPGVFTEPEAVDGATAMLITHEHPDHWTADMLRRTDAPIFTIAAVAEQIRAKAPDAAERVTVVAPGDRIDLGVPPRRSSGRSTRSSIPSCRTSTTPATCSSSRAPRSSTPATR